MKFGLLLNTPAAADPFGGASPFTTIVIVLLVILVLWWLLRAQVGQVEPVADGHHDDHGHDHDHGHHDDGHMHEMHAEAAVMTEAETAVEPEPEAAPAAADDLKVLEGVGPKVEAALNAVGITTYAQLAGTEVGMLQATLDAAGYQYMNPASWPEQAALAAAGDWEALKKLQGELTAGRE